MLLKNILDDLRILIYTYRWTIEDSSDRGRYLQLGSTNINFLRVYSFIKFYNRY